MTHPEFECISELSKQDKRNYHISNGKVFLKRRLKKPKRKYPKKEPSLAGDTKDSERPPAAFTKDSSSLREEVNKLKEDVEDMRTEYLFLKSENSRLTKELNEVSEESVRRKIREALEEKELAERSACRTSKSVASHGSRAIFCSSSHTKEDEDVSLSEDRVRSLVDRATELIIRRK